MSANLRFSFVLFVWLAWGGLAVPALWGQEDCGNGIDDDGNGLIDCFDPACCEACPDHYYSTCSDSLCEIDPPMNPRFDWRERWQFSGDWDNINTPLVGILRAADGPVIVGLTTNEVGTGSRQDILVINGETGNLQTSFPTPPMSEYATTIGLADVTSDGTGNIIIGLSEESAFSRHLQCYDPDGNLIWQSDAPHGFSDDDRNATPLFADFNEDGQAEIYVGNSIFDGLTGRKLMSGNASGYQGAQEARQLGYRFFSPVAADILPDGFCAQCEGLELIAGGQVYAVDIPGETLTLAASVDSTTYGDGFTAISDINADGRLDVVVAERQDEEVFIYVWDPVIELVLAEYTYINSNNTVFTGGSSVPVLTDLNADGLTDLVFSTSLAIVALENTGAGSFIERWEVPTDDLSGRSGPVAFDFTGDGRAEIVHRGQDFLRVINAFNGDILAETNCFSSTYFDKPVVANINSGPQGEILVSCGNNLLAYTSSGDPWAVARPVWNQLPFFNTHINDDLSIPRHLQDIHIPRPGGEPRLNRYMETYSRPINPGPDFVFDRIDVVCENGSRFIETTVCNVGDLRAPIQVFIAAYGENPLEQMNPPLWNVQEPVFMEPGQCLDLRYVFPPFGNVDSAFFTLNIPPGLPFIDTTDVNSFLSPECNVQNNFEWVDLRPFQLEPIALGNDTTLCAGDVDMLTLGPDTTYRNYLWSTGAMTREITVNQSGLYTLMVSDVCGNQGMDSIRVNFIETSGVGLPEDTVACVGDELGFSIDPEFTELVWLDAMGDTLCNNCNTVELEILEATTITVQGRVSGCAVADTVAVDLLPGVTTFDTLNICWGDPVLIDGDWVGEGSYTETFNAPGLCDSVVIIEVIERAPIEFEANVDPSCSPGSEGSVVITPEDSAVDIEWFDGSTDFSRSLEPGTYAFELTDAQGCIRSGTVTIEQVMWQRSNWVVEQIECFEGQDTLPNVPTSLTGRIVARLGADSTFSWSVNGQPINDSIYLNAAPEPGVYNFEVEKGSCRFTTTVEIFPPQEPEEGATVDLLVEPGDSVQLGEDLSAVDYFDIRWIPAASLNCDSCLLVTAFPQVNTNYIFSARDANGCVFEKTYRVFLQSGGSIALPNVFSPNGDGINDFFELNASDPIQQVEYCRIFDRWGKLLFELREGSGTIIPLWDGRVRGEEVNPGVYVYSLQVVDAAGQVLQFSGTITVVK